MRRYQRIYEEIRRNPLGYMAKNTEDDPLIERINAAIAIIKERYQTLDYLRKSPLSKYLPVISEPITKEFKDFETIAEGVEIKTTLAESADYHLDQAKSQDYELYAGIFVPSIKKLTEHLEYLYDEESSGFNPPLAYGVWCVKDGKVYDFAVGSKIQDVAYIGKKIDLTKFNDGSSLMSEVQTWFK